MRIYALLLLFITLLLSACSIPLKSQQPPPQTYRLAPELGNVTGTAKTQSINLYVPAIEVTPGLDSNKIVVLKNKYEQDYIADSQWPDELPKYLHSIIVDSLSNSGAFASVSNRLINANNNYKLLLKVSEFQAELPQAPKTKAQVSLAMEAFVIHSKTKKLLMQKRYKVSGNDVDVRVGEIVKALNNSLNQALGLLLRDIEGMQ